MRAIYERLLRDITAAVAGAAAVTVRFSDVLSDEIHGIHLDEKTYQRALEPSISADITRDVNKTFSVKTKDMRF